MNNENTDLKNIQNFLKHHKKLTFFIFLFVCSQIVYLPLYYSSLEAPVPLSTNRFIFSVDSLVDRGYSFSMDYGLYLTAVPNLYFSVNLIEISVSATTSDGYPTYIKRDIFYFVAILKNNTTVYHTEDSYTFSANRTEFMWLLNHTFMNINLVYSSPDSNGTMHYAVNSNVSLYELVSKKNSWKTKPLNLTNTDLIGSVFLYLNTTNASIEDVDLGHIKKTFLGIWLYLGMYRLRDQEEIISLITPLIEVCTFADIVVTLLLYYQYIQYKKEIEYQSYKAKILGKK